MDFNYKFQQKNNFSLRHLLVIGILVLAFSISFLIRSQALDFGFELNEFDPFFNYRATEFIVENGIIEYLNWHDNMSWYPNGRDISATSQNMLHYTAAITYQIFGMNGNLYNYTILFPVVIGSLTTVIVFALVRVIAGTGAGLFAALLYSISIPIVIRGLIGWFKSEPLGLFYGLLGIYLFLSAIKSNNSQEVILKMIGAGVFLAFGLSAWGGIQFFLLPLGIFFMALPFLRKDHKFQIWTIPLFTGSLMLTLLLFERPGISFITGIGGFAVIGPTIFLVVCNLVQLFSKESKKFRNSILLLTGTIITGISLITISFSTNFLSIPSYRYLNAINPFLTTHNPLVDSVSEHATTTLSQSFFFLSILMVFAALGIWLILQNRNSKIKPHNDMISFALIIGIIGVYVSSAFIRLEVFASISVIVLSSVGLSLLFSRLFNNQIVKSNSKPMNSMMKILFTSGVIILLAAPLVLPAEGNWISMVKIPPTILNGGTVFHTVTPDWPAALSWIQLNTSENSVIAAWWDYGYWITTIGERTTIADNATIDSRAIKNLSKMFLASPDESWLMLREMGADYVMIFVTAQEIPSEAGQKFYQLGGGGDESKKQWFMRIAEEPVEKYIHPDGISGNNLFWNKTMLGKMFPFSPVLYYNPSTGQQSDTYSIGDLPLHVKNIKFLPDGDGPLRLVYASPTYAQDSPIILGVFIYEVNQDYIIQK